MSKLQLAALGIVQRQRWTRSRRSDEASIEDITLLQVEGVIVFIGKCSEGPINIDPLVARNWDQLSLSDEIVRLDLGQVDRLIFWPASWYEAGPSSRIRDRYPSTAGEKSFAINSRRSSVSKTLPRLLCLLTDRFCKRLFRLRDGLFDFTMESPIEERKGISNVYP